VSALAAAPTGAEEKDDGPQLKLIDIKPDKAKPTLIKVNVSGAIKLDLSQPSDVEFYNALVAGKLIELPTTFFVASTKKTHRRDSDGNVDAVPETKSIIVDGVTFDGARVGESEPAEE
jgi:hypothetical protein